MVLATSMGSGWNEQTQVCGGTIPAARAAGCGGLVLVAWPGAADGMGSG